MTVEPSKRDSGTWRTWQALGPEDERDLPLEPDYIREADR